MRAAGHPRPCRAAAANRRCITPASSLVATTQALTRIRNSILGERVSWYVSSRILEVAATAEELASGAQEMSASTQEVAGAAHQIADSASIQTRGIASIVDASTRVAGRALTVAEHARSAQQVADTVASSAKRGVLETTVLAPLAREIALSPACLDRGVYDADLIRRGRDLITATYAHIGPDVADDDANALLQQGLDDPPPDPPGPVARTAPSLAPGRSPPPPRRPAFRTQTPTTTPTTA